MSKPKNVLFEGDIISVFCECCSGNVVGSCLGKRGVQVVS